jgi:DNA repair photolyase
LGQLERLCDTFDPRCVYWRFDPLCYYRRHGRTEDNLKDFHTIAETAQKCGVNRCITSFMDFYPKIKNRVKNLPDFSFVDIAMDQKVVQILEMEKILRPRHIQLALCCEKEVLGALPKDAKVVPSSCIPNDLLRERFGRGISMKKDTGQRVKQGCGCRTSVDIGNYRTQPCRHNCLFCYANPLTDRVKYLQP